MRAFLNELEPHALGMWLIGQLTALTIWRLLDKTSSVDPDGIAFVLGCFVVGWSLTALLNVVKQPWS